MLDDYSEEDMKYLSDDESSKRFMELITKMNMIGGRVYYDTCFEVQNENTDPRQTLNSY